jgi:hypothetical protein
MAASGQSIGGNKYITYLQLDIHNGWLLDETDDVTAFFGGLSLNRSIHVLIIHFYFDEDQDDDAINSFIKQLFDALMPLFQFNNNLRVFSLISDGDDHENVLTSCINDVILSCTSLKSIRVCNAAWTGRLLLDLYWQKANCNIYQ